MKRMKKYSYILLALPLLLGSCEAYLDVNPKSEVTDKELFSTAEGCEDAIYGIYTEMGTNKNLFAYALTFAYPELMTGNFTISQSDNLAYVVQRLWEHENAITVAENLWINGYKAIGYVNKALMHVSATSGSTKANCWRCAPTSISKWPASSPCRSHRATPRPKPRPFPT